MPRRLLDVNGRVVATVAWEAVGFRIQSCYFHQDKLYTVDTVDTIDIYRL